MGDWFRDPDWDESAQAEFERRLSRARSYNKPQYIRIKGLYVEESGNPSGARDLFNRVITEFPHSLDAASAREHLGDLARRAGDDVEAEAHYRLLLSDHPSLNATSGLVELSLAEVLIDRRETGGLAEAAELLEATAARQPSGMEFNDGRFRWSVARSALAVQTGDEQTRRECAQRALDTINEPAQFSRHPTVGLARPDKKLVAWLQSATRTRMRRGTEATPPWQAMQPLSLERDS